MTNFHCRSSYDTIHLVGPGAVGRALLHHLAGSRRRLVAVTDSTATLADAAGLDPLAVVRWKAAGRPLAAHPGAVRADAATVLHDVDADTVVDATSSDLDRRGWTAALDDVLERGACVALAAKAALCEAAATWLSGPHAERVGLNAVLGGTGRDFAADLPELRRYGQGAVVVGNASTTAIIETIERGGTLADGIAAAARLGYLEPDPEQDFRGLDAAVKLAIVAGALTGRRIDPRSIPADDVRSLDIAEVRARVRRNETTRLVGRLAADGTVRVAYEAVSRHSLLAAPCGQVVYEYRLRRNERRLHVGTGLGAAATAAALWADTAVLGAGVAARALHVGLAVAR